MMTAILSAFVVTALLGVAAARRRKSTGLTDAVLYLLAAVTVAIAVTADLPTWAKFGYIFLGVVIAGLTTQGLVRRHTAAAAGHTSHG